MNLLEEIKYRLRSNNAIQKIIVLTVAVFVVLNVLGAFCYLFGIDRSWLNLLEDELRLPAAFGSFIYQPWSLITSMFLHDGVFHILFNMLWLYWMGNILHEYLGNRKVYEAYF